MPCTISTPFTWAWAEGIVHRVAGLAGQNNQFNREILSGVPAKSAGLQYPQGLALSPDGALYGALSFAGEGGLATAATLTWPLGLLVTSDGTLYFTDASAGRVFRVMR